MNSLTNELAAIAEAVAFATADSNAADFLEAQAKAQGYMDADGYWSQSDEDFHADLAGRDELLEHPLAA